MLKYACSLGCCFLVLLTLASAEIAVRVAAGESFRLHIFPNTLDNPTNCTLTNPQNRITVIPLDDQLGSNVELIDQTIEPLGNGQCGVRLHNRTTRADIGRWILTLSNEEEFIIETFRLTLVAREESINRTTTAVIGALGTIILCGPLNNMLYCEMRDPSGNLVEVTARLRCQVQVQRLTARHFGVWSCTVGVIGGTSEIHATNTLVMGGRADEIVIFANQTSLGTVISWRVDRMVQAATWCRAFSPNGQTIMVSPGMENEEYVAVGTDFNRNRCGLLINGKFSEEYHGIWRLEMGISNRRVVGGFIRMPEGNIPGRNESCTTSNSTGSARVTEISVPAGENFRIGCQTQYSASYCWIGGPQGQQFTQSENLTVGRCSLMINGSNSEQHSGIWTCNMGYMMGGDEDQFVTKVNVIERFYRAVNPVITVRMGNKASITCRSTLEFPLQYCRFIRPDGRGLGVMPDVKTSGRYSYEGPGLDYGYCGLAISSVQAVDVGEWKCISRSRDHMWEAEVSDTSVVQISEISVLTTTISVVVGTLMALMIIITATALYYRRRNNRRDSQNTAIVGVGE